MYAGFMYHDAPVAYTIGSFDDDAPRARRGARSDWIIHVITWCNSKPTNPVQSTQH